MKLSECIEQFMIIKKADSREATIKYYDAKLKIISRYLGDYEVEAIDKVVISDFTNKQKLRNPKISPRTLNYYRQIIVRVIKEITGRLIKITKLRVVPPDVKRVSDENISKIIHYYENNIDKANNHKYFLIIRIFLDTGVRINELVNIMVKNINIPYRTIKLETTKTGVPRVVFFSYETQMLLLSYMNKYITNQSYLFPSKKGDSHIQRESIYRALMRLQKRLKIKQSISPHKWRHTFAKSYLTHGGDLSSLQSILVHTQLTTTEMYLKFDYNELRKIYDQTMKNDSNPDTNIK
jgi:site-specific recombinase XerD